MSGSKGEGGRGSGLSLGNIQPEHFTLMFVHCLLERRKKSVESQKILHPGLELGVSLIMRQVEEEEVLKILQCQLYIFYDSSITGHSREITCLNKGEQRVVLSMLCSAR